MLRVAVNVASSFSGWVVVGVDDRRRCCVVDVWVATLPLPISLLPVHDVAIVAVTRYALMRYVTVVAHCRAARS